MYIASSVRECVNKEGSSFYNNGKVLSESGNPTFMILHEL